MTAPLENAWFGSAPENFVEALSDVTKVWIRLSGGIGTHRHRIDNIRLQRVHRLTGIAASGDGTSANLEMIQLQAGETYRVRAWDADLSQWEAVADFVPSLGEETIGPVALSPGLSPALLRVDWVP
jgi:hypothetical protein